MPDWKRREKTNVIGPDHPQPAAPPDPEVEAPRGDADVPPGRQAETPKPRAGSAPLPPEHPSRGMIDEGGVQR